MNPRDEMAAQTQRAKEEKEKREKEQRAYLQAALGQRARDKYHIGGFKLGDQLSEEEKKEMDNVGTVIHASGAPFKRYRDGIYYPSDDKAPKSAGISWQNGTIKLIGPKKMSSAEIAQGYRNSIKFLADQGETSIDIDWEGHVSTDMLKVILDEAFEYGLKVNLSPNVKSHIYSLDPGARPNTSVEPKTKTAAWFNWKMEQIETKYQEETVPKIKKFLDAYELDDEKNAFANLAKELNEPNEKLPVGDYDSKNSDGSVKSAAELSAAQEDSKVEKLKEKILSLADVKDKNTIPPDKIPQALLAEINKETKVLESQLAKLEEAQKKVENSTKAHEVALASQDNDKVTKVERFIERNQPERATLISSLQDKKNDLALRSKAIKLCLNELSGLLQVPKGREPADEGVVASHPDAVHNQSAYKTQTDKLEDIVKKLTAMDIKELDSRNKKVVEDLQQFKQSRSSVLTR